MTMGCGISVVLVDDLAVCRLETRRILDQSSQVYVVAEAENIDSGLLAVRQHAPDVVILDLEMPGGSGLELARAITALGLPVKLILLTVHRSAALADRATRLGLNGYVAKDDAAADLDRCVRAVMDGRTFVSRQIAALQH
jgi:DNA-binding NarL/FixJ family response regulator